MYNITVTGAAGFVGRRLSEILSYNKNNHIIAVDLPCNEKNIPKKENISFVSSDDFRLSVRRGKIPFSTKAVIHLASFSDRFSDDKEKLNDVNFVYPLEIFEACNIHNTPFIYTSDGSVYGHNSDNTPIPENENPLDAYSQSRLNFDNFIRNHLCRGIYCLRLFDVYGAKEENKNNRASSVSQMIWQALKNDYICLDKDYETNSSHDFISVDEVCDIIIFFIKKQSRMSHGIFNVGTGTPYTFKQIVYDIFSMLEKTVNIKHTNITKKEDMIKLSKEYKTANINYLRSCGYTKEFNSFVSNLRHIVSYYSNNIEKIPI